MQDRCLRYDQSEMLDSVQQDGFEEKSLACERINKVCHCEGEVWSDRSPSFHCPGCCDCSIKETAIASAQIKNELSNVGLQRIIVLIVKSHNFLLDFVA